MDQIIGLFLYCVLPKCKRRPINWSRGRAGDLSLTFLYAELIGYISKHSRAGSLAEHIHFINIIPVNMKLPELDIEQN